MTLYDKHTINRIQWQQLVENSSCGSWFQTPEAFDFYSSLSFLQPFVFGVAENDELTGVISGFIQAEGGLIKRFFSRRAIINGGAILHNNISEEALLELLLKTQHELKGQAIYIEFRNFRDYSGYKTVFETSCHSLSFQPVAAIGPGLLFVYRKGSLIRYCRDIIL